MRTCVFLVKMDIFNALFWSRFLDSVNRVILEPLYGFQRVSFKKQKYHRRVRIEKFNAHLLRKSVRVEAGKSTLFHGTPLICHINTCIYTRLPREAQCLTELGKNQENAARPSAYRLRNAIWSRFFFSTRPPANCSRNYGFGPVFF